MLKTGKYLHRILCVGLVILTQSTGLFYEKSITQEFNPTYEGVKIQQMALDMGFGLTVSMITMHHNGFDYLVNLVKFDNLRYLINQF